MTYISSEEIKFMGDDEGWRMEFEKPENRLIRFHRGKNKIDVWYSTMTVGIYIRKKPGKYIRNVTPAKLQNIFKDIENYD